MWHGYGGAFLKVPGKLDSLGVACTRVGSTPRGGGMYPRSSPQIRPTGSPRLLPPHHDATATTHRPFRPVTRGGPCAGCRGWSSPPNRLRSHGTVSEIPAPKRIRFAPSSIVSPPPLPRSAHALTLRLSRTPLPGPRDLLLNAQQDLGDRRVCDTPKLRLVPEAVVPAMSTLSCARLRPLPPTRPLCHALKVGQGKERVRHDVWVHVAVPADASQRCGKASTTDLDRSV
jgi:hypothetical protein